MDDFSRQALTELDKLPAWAAKQGGALTRKEARFLVSRRFALKQVVTTYKVMKAHFKNHHQILPVTLEFPRAQTQRLVTQIDSLLAWYGKSHPAGAWLRAQGFGWRNAGAWIAVIDPVKLVSPVSIWKFLAVKATYGKEGRYRYHTSKVTRTLVKGFYFMLGVGKTFYYRLYKERKAILQAASARGEHIGEIPYFQKALELMTTGRLHMEARCHGVPCAVRELNYGLVPHLPPWVLYTRARRYALKVFTDHLQTALMVTELGRKFGLRPDMKHYPIPNPELIPGLNRVQIIKPGEHVSFRKPRPAKAG